jgi:membrane dipeptidase
MTYIADAHCDTIIEVVDNKKDILKNQPELHISLPKLQENRVKLQIFACFAAVGEWGEKTPSRSNQLLEAVLKLADSEGFTLPRTKSALENAINNDSVSILPAIEGGEALGNSPANVHEVKKKGVVYITLAWGDNDLTGSSFGENRGLSNLGKEVVSEMEAADILVDVSHLSDAGFEDLVACSSKPFIASHSNCRSLCKTFRNLTDDQIREIAHRGGAIGVNFVGAFLNNKVFEYQTPFMKEVIAAFNAGHPDAKQMRIDLDQRFIAESPRATLNDVVDHIEHIISLVGDEYVALGSDFDGFSVGVDAFDDCSGYQLVEKTMRERGFSEESIDKICYQNWLRVFARTMS